MKYNSEDLKPHHGVCAIIKDKQGRILMQDHVKYSFWTIPVGKTTNNQTPEEALIQEVQEECGITPTKFRELTTKSYSYTRNSVEVHLTTHLFDIQEYTGKIINNEPHKHKEQKFLTVEEIMKLPYISDSTVLYLETIGLVREAKLG